MAEAARMQGTVKRFNAKKRFGFVRVAGVEQVLFFLSVSDAAGCARIMSPRRIKPS